MPSLKRKSRAAIESEESEGERSDASQTSSQSQGQTNDNLLAKVEPIYLNNPIDLRQGDQKLKVLVGSFNVLSRELKNAASVLHNVASQLAESLSEDMKDQEFDEDEWLKVLKENAAMKALESEFRVVLDRANQTSIRTDVISGIRQRIVQGHQMTNVYQTYLDKSAEALQEYDSQSPKEKYLKSKLYVDFCSMAWESFTGGASVPNIKKFLPKDESAEGAAGSDSDDEVEIGAQSTDFRCPLTASILEDPFTSTLCPHSYSGEAIKDYINSNAGSVECPVAGCKKRLTLGVVQRDDGLRGRTDAHVRRVKEGRGNATQGGGAASKGRTYVEMEDSDDEDE